MDNRDDGLNIGVAVHDLLCLWCTIYPIIYNKAQLVSQATWAQSSMIVCSKQILNSIMSIPSQCQYNNANRNEITNGTRPLLFTAVHQTQEAVPAYHPE